MDNYELVPLDTDSKYCLQSDSRNRIDLVELFKGNDQVAQDNKTELEVQQRHDRKLREAANKRRKEGGPKIVHSYEK